jgi:hypothetical protein
MVFTIFVEKIKKIKFLIVSMKLLANSENPPSNTSLRSFFRLSVSHL